LRSKIRGDRSASNVEQLIIVITKWKYGRAVAFIGLRLDDL